MKQHPSFPARRANPSLARPSALPAARAKAALALLAVAAILPGIRSARAESAPNFTNRAAALEGVEVKKVNVFSDGTRLSGTLFKPAAATKESPAPGIVASHGWGGTRDHLDRDYAPYFARAGYVVLTIDYRGWGDSDSRLVVEGDQPAPGPDGTIVVKARAIRELVDPFDQAEDIVAAIDFLVGEPGVDPARIGLWGTSYSGGHVIQVAANDPRVKCTVSQVGSMDSLAIPNSPAYPGGLERAIRERTLRARGEAPPVPQGVDVVPGLKGTPYVSRMASYRPVELAHKLRIPVCIIDVDREELFDIADNGRRVYDIVKENAPARYELFEGYTHYAIYMALRPKALPIAIEWFDEHLKGK